MCHPLRLLQERRGFELVLGYCSSCHAMSVFRCPPFSLSALVSWLKGLQSDPTRLSSAVTKSASLCRCDRVKVWLWKYLVKSVSCSATTERHSRFCHWIFIRNESHINVEGHLFLRINKSSNYSEILHQSRKNFVGLEQVLHSLIDLRICGLSCLTCRCFKFGEYSKWIKRWTELVCDISSRS